MDKICNPKNIRIGIMRLLPIKYKQPTDSGDARCALYAMCNLFDDRVFLLFNNVGESTSHNTEVEILKKYAEISDNVNITGIRTIYPHAITPNEIPLEYSEAFNICNDPGYYIPVLIDFASAQSGVYHTVLCLWGEFDCIVIDSKKDFPETIGHMDIFRKASIHGFRIFTGSEPDNDGEIQVCALLPEQLPHIFDLNDTEK